MPKVCSYCQVILVTNRERDFIKVVNFEFPPGNYITIRLSKTTLINMLHSPPNPLNLDNPPNWTNIYSVPLFLDLLCHYLSFS